jgi:DNA-binding GntR family transcriptional regulator
MQLKDQTQSEIYTSILRAVIKGEYPPGHRLVEQDLATAYNVSRTPIREVLVALAQDGLVERVRNQGARVVRFTPDDVEEIYEMRQALECFSMRRATLAIPLNRLIALERRLKDLETARDDEAWMHKQADIDLQLHSLIVSHSHNHRLTAYMENVTLLITSLQLIGYQNTEHVHSAAAEHLEIVRAIFKRDAILAEHLLAGHIENSKRHALELFLRRTHPPR